jgi:hypothetical protein
MCPTLYNFINIVYESLIYNSVDTYNFSFKNYVELLVMSFNSCNK